MCAHKFNENIKYTKLKALISTKETHLIYIYKIAKPGMIMNYYIIIIIVTTTTTTTIIIIIERQIRQEIANTIDSHLSMASHVCAFTFASLMVW